MNRNSLALRRVKVKAQRKAKKAERVEWAKGSLSLAYKCRDVYWRCRSWHDKPDPEREAELHARIEKATALLQAAQHS
jgi:hypothetical protein